MDLNTSTETSLIHDISFWTGVTTATYTTAERVRSINEWYRVVNKEIWANSQYWQYDDSNYSNLPIAETNLVDGQEDYEMPSEAQNVEAVEVQNNDGNWFNVPIIDRSEVDMAWAEFHDTPGFPVAAELMARSIILKPAPASGEVTTTNGIRLYLSRTIDNFSITDTNKTPGFDEDFHRILSFGASLDYMIANERDTRQTDRVQGYINDYLKRLREFYGQRVRSRNPRIIPHQTKTV